MALAITGSMTTAAHAAPSLSELTKQIETASNKLEDITESYNKLRGDMQKTAADQKTITDSLAPAKAKLDVATAQVGTIAATTYMQGRVGPFSALIGGAGGPDSLMDRMSYLDLLARANQHDIDDFATSSAAVSDRQTALSTTEARQALQLKELDAQKKKIEGDIKKLRALRTQAYGSATETAASGAAGSPPAVSGDAGVAVDYAYAAANKPAYYGYGEDGPSLYDCSGLTMAAWKAAGHTLPHNAAQQYSATTRITRSQLKPGDLVFYRSLGHVGLYVGSGMIIDASREGEPVKKRTIDIMVPYGYGRVT